DVLLGIVPQRTADYETLLNYAKEDIPYYIPEGTSKKYSVHELLGLVQPKDKEELVGLGDKIGVKLDEKASFMDMLLGAVEITITPPFVNLNITELFKQIRDWDKQKRNKKG
ncbi:MAG: hypothetical protein D3919_15855, partial [Candidatus Electrothrix sp. AW5]|nr:hypothetical protein [Candidatus Electrothrix gigas]